MIDATYSIEEAIGRANEQMGVVIGNGQRYIWKRARKTSCSPISVTVGEADANGSPIAKCISAILNKKDINLNEQELLDSGDTPKEVLEDTMQDCTILDLSGCEIEELLYYISNGNPVFAMTGENDAVLITGYDTNSITFYDPASNSNKTLNMETATELFLQAGDTFFTYME